MGGLCGKPEGKKVRESFLKGDPLYVCVTQLACRLPRASEQGTRAPARKREAGASLAAARKSCGLRG